MRAREAISLAVLSGMLGMLVFQWSSLAQLFGLDAEIQRSGSLVTVEYLWGMPVVLVLGLIFYRHPIWCAVWFMFGPVLILHPIKFIELGRIPNLWPIEITLLGVLTLPYIGISWAAAYLRRRYATG